MSQAVIERIMENMVFVEGGIFQMGATQEQEGVGKDESLVHTVKLDDFYIGRHPVAQEELLKLTGHNSRFYQAGWS